MLDDRVRRVAIDIIPRILILIALALFAPSQTRASDLRLEGKFIQGGLVIGHAPSGVRVSIDGAPVRVSDEGVFVFGFGRDAPASARLEIAYPDGRVTERVLDVEKRAYRIQRIDGLPERKVTPSEADLARISQEAAMVRAARARDDPRTDFLDGFIWPATGRISGVYGSQRILNGEPRRPHFGVDVAGPVGTPVRAPAPGLVTLAHPDMFFSGGTLIIDHGHGLSSSFLHLSEILVEHGQRVRRGDLIARIGATGRATGPHLDWRMNWFDARIDPALLAGPMPAE
ncbi:MAG: M23 family metallopeptidase [Gammaproteobacteria bacterium]|nr:M23 family metallopeptidase [Gammaproteobacteria bacterium]